MALSMPALFRGSHRRRNLGSLIVPWGKLTVGIHTTANAYIRALTEAGITISDAAIEQLYKKEFVQVPRDVELAVCEPRTLEWVPRWSYADLIASAAEMGVVPCIPDVAPALVGQNWKMNSDKEKSNDGLTIIEPPVPGSTAPPVLFRLSVGMDNAFYRMREGIDARTHLGILPNLILFDRSALVFMIP